MKNVARICFLTVLWLSFVASVAAQEKPATNVFVFNGGDLSDFVSAIKNQLGFDLHAQVTGISRHEYTLAVPRMFRSPSRPRPPEDAKIHRLSSGP